MNLNILLEVIEIKNIFGNTNIDIKGLSYDSRKVSPGDMFFALNGTHTNGIEFSDQAISKGAVCIVSDTEIKNCSCTNIVVNDVFLCMSKLSAKFYDYPDKKLTIIGVTGTNGKTSITYMTESIFKKLNINIGVIGTISYRYADVVIDAPNTTPQSLDLYKMMSEMVKSNIKYLIMEVSSHSLELGRVFGIEFDIAVFTNLTQDHLDFHKNMDNYFNAKKRLFYSLSQNLKNNKKFAIINSDDFYGKKLLEDSRIAATKISYSTISKYGNIFCFAKDILLNSKYSSFTLESWVGDAEIEVNHIGLHNVYNILAVICICISTGIELRKIVECLKYMTGAPGRLELIKSNKKFSVVVDYAHTDDALKNVLEAIKNLKPSKIITVFGCGGNRDKTKRPKMAKVACSMSDFVFITSDNPREEEPVEITKDIEAGAKEINKTNYKVIVDRKEAIKQAIIAAKEKDVVLIAGKGHENYQIIGRNKIHFDDRETASEILNKI
ncbi:UDP-N-acetylmuramoyl-L-alanyl-D-glutamate--2,6-diaminopimelate ligase [Candidatus Ruminimicrobiellum ovillum]|uniref:UDP-N-acetylmuramoyl-L-alanyl-D-glutamate--2, 6-diaminopimelate ligase n=1 Tax=Candidatus Ruminimicrobiellum ovillum TaxID=1947927 RepID=UPI00355ABA0F